MARAKLFQYAILWHPNDKQEEEGVESTVIVGLTTVLAEDQGTAQMIAVKSIPDIYTQKDYKQIDIVVRPF